MQRQGPVHKPVKRKDSFSKWWQQIPVDGGTVVVVSSGGLGAGADCALAGLGLRLAWPSRAAPLAFAACPHK